MSTSAKVKLTIEYENGTYRDTIEMTSDGYPSCVLNDVAGLFYEKLENGDFLGLLDYINENFQRVSSVGHGYYDHEYEFEWKDGEWSAEKINDE